jgi:Starch-binding associating with outer membrane
MKKINILIAGILIITSMGCKKYLDINNNPNGPSQADPALYIPSIQMNLAQGLQFDGRLIGPYIQNILNSATSTTGTAASADIHGYAKASDFGGSLWRSVYWKGGQNLQDLKNNATNQKKWDILGAGLAMEAFGWQMLTDYHGPVILKEAYDPARNVFDYDTEDTVYAYIQSECMNALAVLNKSDDAVGSPLFKNFDQIYKGDRVKWTKFVYGILAINAHHLIKKSFYKPDDVIAYVDKALASNADNAIVPFAGTIPDDASGYGVLNVGTNTFGVFGQSNYIVKLTNGTGFFAGVTDPRQAIMLTPSTDGVYRGLNPGSGQSSSVSSSSTGVRSLFGTTLGTNTITQTTPGSVGKYLFNDKAGFPLMTYSELQFIKAEAAFVKGDKPLALAAYTAAVNASLDFVRSYTTDATLIANFNAQRTLYLASPAVIPTAATLTINHILLQKYIALWGWGFIETWTDMRKHDYSNSVYNDIVLPTFFSENNGKPAYRVRPRYNSEYLWNIDALTKIGGFDPDYHTKKIWIQQP